MFNSSTSDLPNFLIDAIPGAREALDASRALAESPKAVELNAAVRAAMDARKGRVRHINGVLSPAVGVTFAEFDQLNADLADAEAAQVAFGREVRAARAAYEKLITRDALAAVGANALAAQRALDLHAEAVAAFATLQRVLPERDRAWRLSGIPGRGWSEPNGFGHSVPVMNDRGPAEHFYGEALARFGTAALVAVVNAEVSK